MVKNTIISRKSIHDIVPTRQRDESSEEFYHDDSQDLMSYSSGSELECGEDEIIYENRKKIGLSRSMSRTPQRSNIIKPEKREIPAEKVILNSNYIPSSKRPSPLLIISVIIIFLAVYCVIPKGTAKENKKCTFDILQKKYPKENSYTWKQLRIGIESILNKKLQTPAVYLLANYGGQHALKIIKDIAERTSDCFGQKLIPMESNDFMSAPGIVDDYGYAIEKYRNKIKDGNVILIANLNEIPAAAARALHTICDTYSPIARHVVIFLTLTISADRQGSADSMAEETLINLWGATLKRNELDPLITRVTDQVIILKS